MHRSALPALHNAHAQKPVSRARRRALLALAAALVLAACPPLLSACSEAKDHTASLALYDNGEELSDTERVVSAGSLPANSWTIGTSDDELTELSLGLTLPASLASDETPNEVTYTAACDDVMLANPNAIPEAQRVSLSEAVDNPAMAFLYQLQQIATEPSESITLSGDEATNILLLSATVPADEEALSAMNEIVDAEALQQSADALPPETERIVTARLADGFVTVRATYDDGSVVERTYALAAHEVDDEGAIQSYVLTDITDR